MEAAKTAYEIAYEESISEETRDKFWAKYLDEVTWLHKPTNILDTSDSPFNLWFKDGKLNMAYNCIDRHAKEHPGNPAIIYDSPMTDCKMTITYRDLLENVSKLAGGFKKLGISKGDTVIIYMPMIPEAIYGMLASVRIGAIHSVVFGGFAAKELASRIEDAKPKIILSTSCGLEPNKTIDYKHILDSALEMCAHKEIRTIIVQRPQHRTNDINNKRDLDYHTLMELSDPADCVEVESTHPLYILYTSGTTGIPKGITRDTGGTAIALSWAMKHIMNVQKGETYFAGSDIGWVVGHSFIVYGPLLVGAKTILYEGKPVGTPNPGAYWRIVESYQVKAMFTAPTALRAIRKEDSEGAYMKKYDLSSLKTMMIAGERLDIPTFDWICGCLPNTLIFDNYWQTESGWPMVSNFANLTTFKNKPGSCNKPVPGYNLKFLDDNEKECGPNELGNAMIKLPLPPSFVYTLWNNRQGFYDKYLSIVPGYYLTGDAGKKYKRNNLGYFDKEGYVHVMSRIDDIINTAGHRLSTAAMEEVLISHKAIADAAVVPAKDDLKGEVATGLKI